MEQRQSPLENLVMKADFWKGKKVLVTGHTGFKGSWFCHLLYSLGAKVYGYSLAPAGEKSLYETTCVGDVTRGVFSDVRDLDSLRNFLSDIAPDIVVHMAAQALVRESYRDPVGTYTTNVVGTLNLLESLRSSNTVRVGLIITSDKCYENREWIWGYRENERLGGNDPYSNSKACTELVVAAYRKSFFDNAAGQTSKPLIATARAGNVIGGGDWAYGRLIPDTVKAFSKGQDVVLRFPDAVRPWQHVLDALHGYVLLIEHLWEHGQQYADAWNFGPTEDSMKSVRWMVERISELWDGKTSWRNDKEDNVKESNFLVLDSSKARTSLGWRPHLPIEEALRLTIDWYREELGGGDVSSITREQIKNYRKIVAV